MIRRLLTIAEITSLVLCAIVAGLGLRSFRLGDYVSRTWASGTQRGTTTMTRWTLLIGHGDAAFIREHGEWETRRVPVDPERQGWRWDNRPPESFLGVMLRGKQAFLSGKGPSIWNRAGFGAFSSTWSRPPEYEESQVVCIPLWFPVALLAAAPAVRRGRAWRLARRGGRGQCPRCGYDLRATPERCPECGAAVAVADERL
jgi:hypothetical protein